MRKLKNFGPQMAWRPFWMMRLTEIVTITIPNSLVPCRTKGVYTLRFNRAEKSAPKMVPASRPIQMLAPALLHM